ncbi:hypothetical protein PYW07_007000 [Mythimna separata]|uniref:Farnesoic acid O-methyl transferase domain-containing protein n=1 Tax=Mythimna separata TaxID=271217 RepID=A0AAD7Z1E7_MYTSE|nr:hypothetical protein PYW07_007000 [Mythimna separata]
MDPMYEIILGGWRNKQSVLRYCRKKPDKVIVSTPRLLDPDNFKKFLIKWRKGKVTVQYGDSSKVIMEWQDFTSFGISHFGVRTFGASGQWCINHFDDHSAS